MNQGMPTTQADQAQQQLALNELQQYSKTELPALGFQIQQLKTDAAGEPEAMAGRASGTAREQTAQALTNANMSDAARGVSPGSGSSIARKTGIMAAGGANLGEAISAGRAAGESDIAGKKLGIIGSGNALLSRANQAVESATNTADQVTAAKRQAKSALSGGIASLLVGSGTTALLA